MRVHSYIMSRQSVAPQVARHAVRLVARGARVGARPVRPVHVFPQVARIADVTPTYGAEAASRRRRDGHHSLQGGLVLPTTTQQVQQRSYSPSTTSRRGVVPAPYYVPQTQVGPPPRTYNAPHHPWGTRQGAPPPAAQLPHTGAPCNKKHASATMLVRYQHALQPMLVYVYHHHHSHHHYHNHTTTPPPLPLVALYTGNLRHQHYRHYIMITSQV